MTARILSLALTLMATTTVAAQTVVDPWDPALKGPVGVKGTRFTDEVGREVLLRGVNAGKKNGDFLPPHTQAEVEALVKASGVNVVRLYVAWRAIAPAPGRFDKTYLAAVRERAQRWSKAGVYVLIDMHQDVWGGPITSHGAPGWATLVTTGGLKLPPGSPWQMSYVDPRVWGSFEALWSNRIVPGTGRGLQDHYADAWVELVRALEGVERIVGYDLINEPFIGGEVKQALEDLLKGAAGPALAASGRAVKKSTNRGLVHGMIAVLSNGGPANPLAPFHGARAATGSFKRTIKRDLEQELLALVQDPKQHHRILGALGKVNTAFERRLSAFYARVGRRIRAVDPRTAIFVEPMALVGIGVPAGLPHPGLKKIVYAPHLYDAFVDSGMGFDGELDRLRRTLTKHRLTAARLRAPLFLGEWGHLDTLPQGGKRDQYANGAAQAIERAASISATYWEHRPGDEAGGALDLVLRPYARRIAGRALGGNRFDPLTKTLRVRFRPAASLFPTVISAPARLYPNGVLLKSTRTVRWRYLSERGLVLVHATAGADVLLELRPKP